MLLHNLLRKSNTFCKIIEISQAHSRNLLHVSQLGHYFFLALLQFCICELGAYVPCKKVLV